jgi:hypothetical protein
MAAKKAEQKKPAVKKPAAKKAAVKKPAVKKAKEWQNCAHCGAKDATGTEDKGYKRIITDKTAMQYITCPCGIITRLCRDELILKSVWNSRPNKPVKIPIIEVKSSKTTHVDPELLSTGDNKTEPPDEF